MNCIFGEAQPLPSFHHKHQIYIFSGYFYEMTRDTAKLCECCSQLFTV